MVNKSLSNIGSHSRHEGNEKWKFPLRNVSVRKLSSVSSHIWYINGAPLKLFNWTAQRSLKQSTTVINQTVFFFSPQASYVGLCRRGFGSRFLLTTRRRKESHNVWSRRHDVGNETHLWTCTNRWKHNLETPHRRSRRACSKRLTKARKKKWEKGHFSAHEWEGPGRTVTWWRL